MAIEANGVIVRLRGPIRPFCIDCPSWRGFCLNRFVQNERRAGIFPEIVNMFEKFRRKQPVQPESSGPILYYNDAVLDHFSNPRNVGEMTESETDGFGLVGDPACGDQMKLWISVKSGRIARIAFKSYGCPGAIATSSMLTALAENKTIEEANRITDDEVIAALGGIPEKKKHCSLLGVRALQAAIADWQKRRA
jgi:nitrogen fixation protein NifU and related proteins